MTLREQILSFVRSPAYKPCDEAGLLRQLGLEKRRKASLTHEVRQLLASGQLTRLPGDRLQPGGSEDEILGRVMVKGSGLVFVRPAADSPEADKGDILLEEGASGTALNGDTVAVRIVAAPSHRRPREQRNRAGRLVRIVERANETVIGALIRQGKHLQLQPDDPRLPLFRVLSLSSPENEYRAGDKVVLNAKPWEDAGRPPEGRVTRKLGRQWEPGAELLGVFEKFHLDRHFPEAVEREAAAIPSKVREQDIEGRQDYREIPTLTIDPDDAKDFDDALSIETLPGGLTRVGIHIADVSAYVRPGSALDREAQRRGNSTYLVGTVIPMLPERLSNGVCSLVEGEDRLCLAALLTFDKNCRIRKTEFARTVIRSRKRLAYRQALALLFESDFDRIRALPALPVHQTGSTGRPLSSLTDLELVDLQTWLRKLWAIAKKLRASRMEKGSLDLDMPETKIYVDEKGFAERLQKMVHDESHQLIEEFMLAANEATARLTRSEKLHSIYRVHDEPDFQRLDEYRQFAATLNVTCGDLNRREEVLRLLANTATHPQGHLLKSAFLRSLRKACYRATPDGHYGLMLRDYTHFTSPIRRYADLIVHRVLIRHLTDPAKRGEPLPVRPALDTLAEHISETEGNSQEAERESWKIKILEFFERELQKKHPSSFEAVITDIRNTGLFIELTESLTFGFIKADTLGNDHFVRSHDGAALEGRRSKQRFALGSRLQVRVSSVDRQRRLIDFVPEEDTPS